jgi:DNA-binding IclR family transcriptional regulator
VHRIINTLESVGFVSQAPPGHVRLGSALAVLGAAASPELTVELHPYLEALSVAINESVMLATLDREKLMCVDFIASPQSLQAVAKTGMPLPIHCTAIGKAVLPELTEEEFADLIPNKLHLRTANTIATRDLLWEEASRIKAAGVAFDREEYEMGICGLGTTVPCSKRMRAAIGVLVPSVRFYGNEEKLAAELARTRDLIRSRLGAV